MTLVGIEYVSHPLIKPVGPSSARAGAFAGVWWDQHLEVLNADDLVDVLLIPIPRVCEHHAWTLARPDPLKLLAHGPDHRSEIRESPGPLVISAARTTCCSLTTACAL
jgi:hypothetical protein